jgi:hypothetical protein
LPLLAMQYTLQLYSPAKATEENAKAAVAIKNLTFMI